MSQLVFYKVGYQEEWRRFSERAELKALQSGLRSIFSELPEHFHLVWIDDDKEAVIINSDPELNEAITFFHNAGQSTVRLFLKAAEGGEIEYDVISLPTTDTAGRDGADSEALFCTVSHDWGTDHSISALAADLVSVEPPAAVPAARADASTCTVVTHTADKTAQTQVETKGKSADTTPREHDSELNKCDTAAPTGGSSADSLAMSQAAPTPAVPEHLTSRLNLFLASVLAPLSDDPRGEVDIDQLEGVGELRATFFHHLSRWANGALQRLVPADSGPPTTPATISPVLPMASLPASRPPDDSVPQGNAVPKPCAADSNRTSTSRTSPRSELSDSAVAKVATGNKDMETPSQRFARHFSLHFQSQFEAELEKHQGTEQRLVRTATALPVHNVKGAGDTSSMNKMTEQEDADLALDMATEELIRVEEALAQLKERKQREKQDCALARRLAKEELAKHKQMPSPGSQASSSLPRSPERKYSPKVAARTPTGASARRDNDDVGADALSPENREKLEHLQHMGFKDRTLNLFFLSMFHGDVNKTADHMLSLISRPQS